jgi:hypothetical protein
MSQARTCHTRNEGKFPNLWSTRCVRRGPGFIFSPEQRRLRGLDRGPPADAAARALVRPFQALRS